MKIVVAEKISPAGINSLREKPGWTIVGPEEYGKDPGACLEDADALIVRSVVQANQHLLEKASKLRVIGRAGIGVDNVDVEYATKRGIVVMNTPGGNAIAVAELTIGLMVSLARNIPRADVTTRAGQWEKKSLQGTELNGKTLGVVGLGRIGAEVARRAQAMNLTVLAYDPYVSPEYAKKVNARLASLDEIWANADYVTFHVGLTEQTQGLVNAATLKKMKKGVRIINCARGELIDDAALAEALASGHVAGAALDVFAAEPPKGNPLLAAPNVIATPHIAGSTDEAQNAVGVQIAMQVRTYLTTGVAQNAVNLPSISELEYQQISPYLDVAERSAIVLALLLDGNLEEIHLAYSGPIAKWKTSLVRAAAIKGVLQQAAVETVNLINAPSLAGEIGVRVTDEVEEESEGPSEITIVLRSSRNEVSAKGIVVHRVSPRIIELNHVELEAPLDGHLLVITNRDLPGVVGKIGSLLGDNNVNIARFALGRELHAAKATRAGSAVAAGEANRAYAIINVDTRVPEPVLLTLRNMEEVIAAFPVSFA
jgi:D-3-phosphoglycerate dehydrogenase